MGSHYVSVLVPEERLGEFYARLGAWLTGDPAAAARDRPAARAAGRSRYQKLATLFADAPPQLTITFKEIERRTGLTLPPTARKYASWWANTPNHPHSRHWLEAGYVATGVDLEGERLVFKREAGDAHREPPRPTSGTQTRRGPGSRYEKLSDLFTDTLDVATFHFEEIEQRTGLALPASARKYPAWWANSGATHQGRAWLAAGYQVTRADLDRQSVTFKRLP